MDKKLLIGAAVGVLIGLAGGYLTKACPACEETKCEEIKEMPEKAPEAKETKKEKSKA